MPLFQNEKKRKQPSAPSGQLQTNMHWGLIIYMTKSPVGWLPRDQDQLQAQRSYSGILGLLYIFCCVYADF